MPTIARIRDGVTVRKHENKYGPGITPHYLESNQVGAVEFDSTLFTADQATEWLTAHDYQHFTLSDGKEQADANEQKHRFLSIELAPSSDIQEMDGGLLVPGVKLLAPGTWTDSTQKTPCRYTPEVLERFCSNWTDRSYWSRHSGGTPRDITDRIADIRNIRYQDGITADLFFHGATSKSADAISLIKAAQAGKVPWPYSSVEMYTRDKWIVSEKIFEAQEILFDGAAMVNQGACRTCKIRNNSGTWEEVTEKDFASVPGNPAGAGIAAPGSSCKLSRSDFPEDMPFSEIRKRFAIDRNAPGEENFSALGLPHHNVAGDVLPNCVAAALQAIGGARTGTPMDLGGKEAAVKAHLQAHETEIHKKSQELIKLTEIKELEAQIEALKKELADAKAKPVTVEIPKELQEKIDSRDKTIKELSERLSKLEKAPADPKTRGAETKELEGPIFFVHVDRDAGTVR